MDEKLSEVIENIYASALGEMPWETTLSRIQDLFGVAGVHFYGVDVAANWETTFQYATGNSAEFSKIFSGYVASIDPRSRYQFDQQVGVLAADLDILTEREIAQSEFYQDFLSKYDMKHSLGAKLYHSDQLAGGLGLLYGEGQGAPSDEHARLYYVLMPHLQRAISIMSLIGIGEGEKNTAFEVFDRMALGVALLGLTGNVLEVNDRLRSIVSKNDGLSLTIAGLRAENSKERHTLNKAIESAIGGVPRDAQTEHVISRRSGKSPLLVSVAPSANPESIFGEAVRAVVLVRDTAERAYIPINVIETALELTLAEAQLVKTLVEGGSVADYASQRGVTIGTARWRLKQIFIKTGTHRQSELVLLVLRSTSGLLPVFSMEQRKA